VARYGQPLKDNAVARLLLPESAALEVVDAPIAPIAGTTPKTWGLERLVRLAISKRL
jgi:hypothetical protein